MEFFIDAVKAVVIIMIAYGLIILGVILYIYKKFLHPSETTKVSKNEQKKEVHSCSKGLVWDNCPRWCNCEDCENYI